MKVNIQRPEPNECNPYFQKYIALVPARDFNEMFRMNGQQAIHFFNSIPADKHNYAYAADKWTIKQVLMHIIDTERVMSYRALVAARADSTTVLHGMDENSYARNADVTDRTMESLISEFAAVRAATGKIYEHITEDQSRFLAKGDTYPFSARALGYIMAGHVLHHLQVTNERYL